MRHIYFAVAALLLICTPQISAPAEQIVVLDPARTAIDFTLGDVLHTVHGAFKLKNGEIRFDSETGKASGSVVVDAASGSSGSAARDRRMHKNVLESGRYPEVVFTPDSVQGSVSGNATAQLQVHGVFRIHGAEHETTLPFAVRIEAGQVTAETHFSLPYVKWGMKNPSTFLFKVNETVDVNVRALGRLSAAKP